MKILAQGAEAVISLEENSEGSRIVKERIKKSYRIPQLDEKIRKERTAEYLSQDRLDADPSHPSVKILVIC